MLAFQQTQHTGMTPMKNKTDDLRSWSTSLPLNGKITYLGDQEKPVPSVFFGPAVPASVYEVFQRFQSANIDYSNDTAGNAKHFVIDSQEQAAILTNLADIIPGDPPVKPRWALVMVQIAPSGPRAIEWFLNDGLARQVVNAIGRSLAPENTLGKQILSQMPLL